MLLGLLALGGATVILCVGNSIAVLAVGRFLQGISAAVPWVVGLALLVDTVGPDEVGQVMGYVGLSMSLAMLVAPLLGGIVFATSGYYAVFAMAFGLMALDIFLRIVMIEKKVAAKWIPVEDTLGVEARKTAQGTRHAVDNGATDSVVMADLPDTSSSPSKERPDLERMTSIRSERSAVVNEMLPQSTPEAFKRFTAALPPVVFLLASRRVLSALWACLMQATLLTSFDTILPLFVRDTFHWTSLGAGLSFLPIVVPAFLGPIFGYLSDKHGPRWYATAGFALACPFLILLRLVHEDTLEQKVLLCALLALIGLCLTMMLTPMMAEITYAVDAKAQRRPEGFFGKNGAYAQAYSLFNMAWAGGCLVGPLLSGLVTQKQGWSVATLILGCVSIFTAVPTAVWTGGSIIKKARRKREGTVSSAIDRADTPLHL